MMLRIKWAILYFEAGKLLCLRQRVNQEFLYHRSSATKFRERYIGSTSEVGNASALNADPRKMKHFYKASAPIRPCAKPRPTRRPSQSGLAVGDAYSKRELLHSISPPPVPTANMISAVDRPTA